jgi:hypothetical protein
VGIQKPEIVSSPKRHLTLPVSRQFELGMAISVGADAHAGGVVISG